MKYKIVRTPVAPIGSITIVIDRSTKVVFNAKGGELSEAEVKLLEIFKKEGKWLQDSIFVRFVKSGRLKIEGDKELSFLFAQDLPKITSNKAAAKPKTETLESLAEQMKALDAKYLALKQAQEVNAEKAPPAGGKDGGKPA